MGHCGWDVTSHISTVNASHITRLISVSMTCTTPHYPPDHTSISHTITRYQHPCALLSLVLSHDNGSDRIPGISRPARRYTTTRLFPFSRGSTPPPALNLAWRHRPSWEPSSRTSSSSDIGMPTTQSSSRFSVPLSPASSTRASSASPSGAQRSFQMPRWRAQAPRVPVRARCRAGTTCPSGSCRRQRGLAQNGRGRC